jgi:uncharacterized protein (DUF2235 family)
LSPQQINLTGAALTAYKQFSLVAQQQEAGLRATRLLDGGEEPEDGGPLTRDDQAAQFARIVSSKWPTIRYVGVWDTIASVFVPRPDRLYLPSLQQLAFIQENPSVKIFRQAISIDERRRMFRLEPWKQPQIFMRNRFSRTNNEEPQDSQQVWFAGVHADIGGGYPESESGLSKYPLLWMIEEAVKCGLAVDRRTVNHLAWGKARKGSPFSYVAPDFTGELHDSMSANWRLLEFFPKSDRYKEWKQRRSLLGYYIPDAEPRPIPENALVHESVVKRREAVPDYKPLNLPSQYRTIPMPVEPGASATSG